MDNKKTKQTKRRIPQNKQLSSQKVWRNMHGRLKHQRNATRKKDKFFPANNRMGQTIKHDKIQMRMVR